ALQLKPGNARAYHNRVLARFNLGLSQDALPNYEQALLEQPAFADDYRDALTFHLSRTKSGQ
ncbi:MAG: hypothetical protein OXF76_18595, partial [Caldilineaceae bacterium]|nr:hypothetical protein [Caldilineaceae bacterium]